MGIEDFFNGSESHSGWVHRFVSRNNLKSVKFHGEAASVDLRSVEKDCEERVRPILDEYRPHNIYNMDETGLYFRSFPTRGYILGEESCRRARGTKNLKAKNRVTILVCANATGTDKVPLAIIGKSKSPVCFRGTGNGSPLPYYSQNNSWATRGVILRWLREVFVPHVKKQTSEPVLLFWDNCSAHEVEFKDSQVTVIFLAANSTSTHQPMDIGVIVAIKTKYKMILVQRLVETMGDSELRALGSSLRKGTAGLAFGFLPHLRDVAEILKDIWNAVSAETIVNCFLKSPLWSVDQTEQLEGFSDKKGTYRHPINDNTVSEICAGLSKIDVSNCDDILLALLDTCQPLE